MPSLIELSHFPPRSRTTGFLRLAVLAFLSAIASRGAIIINEIHYAPDIKTEAVEFVELYNTASSIVDVSFWTLDGGIQFAFPSGTKVESTGYLVIAQDPRRSSAKFGVHSALGPWTGKLSNQGDQIILRNLAGDTVDEVEYQLGFPWPTVGDEPGYSIELVNSTLDNNLGGSWRSSIGRSATRDAALLPQARSWKYFKGTSEASSPTTAWRELDFDDGAWSTGDTPIGYGENFLTTPLTDMRAQPAIPRFSFA